MIICTRTTKHRVLQLCKRHQMQVGIEILRIKNLPSKPIPKPIATPSILNVLRPPHHRIRLFLSIPSTSISKYNIPPTLPPPSHHLAQENLWTAVVVVVVEEETPVDLISSAGAVFAILLHSGKILCVAPTLWILIVQWLPIWSMLHPNLQSSIGSMSL